MVGYLLFYMPFTELTNNLLNLYNECVICTLCFLILAGDAFAFDIATKQCLGWVLLAMISLSLLATWVLLLPGVLKELLKSVKGFFGHGQTGKDLEKDCDPLPLEPMKTVGLEKVVPVESNLPAKLFAENVRARKGKMIRVITVQNEELP